MRVCSRFIMDHCFALKNNLRIKQSKVHQLPHPSSQIEVVKNSTSGKEWTSIDLKWRAPEKHPAGKITIRYSGRQTQLVYSSGRIIFRKNNPDCQLNKKFASSNCKVYQSSKNPHTVYGNEMYNNMSLIAKLRV